VIFHAVSAPLDNARGPVTWAASFAASDTNDRIDKVLIHPFIPPRFVVRMEKIKKTLLGHDLFKIFYAPDPSEPGGGEI
jgi:hypothetical protein